MLNSAQSATLRADISTLSQAGQPLETAVLSQDWQAVANYYNEKPVAPILGWNTSTPTSDILDSINWTAYTPTDTADSTALYTNRIGIIGIKQMNLQNILSGRATIDASKSGIRAGLRDSVIALPSGVSGAAVSAGGASGVNVLNACTRLSTRLEILFANTPVTTGTVSAVIYTVQGKINQQEISDIWGNLQ
jgi:hypothetical protein